MNVCRDLYARRTYSACLHGNLRMQIGVAVLMLALYSLSIIYGSWFNSTVPVFQAAPLDMTLTGTKLWDEKLAYHEYQPRNVEAFQALRPGEVVCQGFFALWPGDCSAKFLELDDRMRVLSAQMQAMNSSLVLFASEPAMCDFPYPGISVQIFNATELLVEMGFAAAFPRMAAWPPSRFTRISDILRIGLAHHHGRSYLDTDVTFLLLRADAFQRSYAGAALWANAKNALEITNAAFCLPRPALLDMMAFQRARVLKGSENFFYTELGPSMFHNVLMNRYAVALYSQNHPAVPSLDAIARDVHQFGHLQLHLTGHVRKGNSHKGFGELVNAIRAKCGLPLLSYPAPSPIALTRLSLADKDQKK